MGASARAEKGSRPTVVPAFETVVRSQRGFCDAPERVRLVALLCVLLLGGLFLGIRKPPSRKVPSRPPEVSPSAGWKKVRAAMWGLVVLDLIEFASLYAHNPLAGSVKLAQAMGVRTALRWQPRPDQSQRAKDARNRWGGTAALLIFAFGNAVLIVASVARPLSGLIILDLAVESGVNIAALVAAWRWRPWATAMVPAVTQSAAPR